MRARRVVIASCLAPALVALVAGCSYGLSPVSKPLDSGAFADTGLVPDDSAADTGANDSGANDSGASDSGGETGTSDSGLDTAAEDPDNDGDGVPASQDCDDRDARRHPGAVDVGGDGIDQDCDGVDDAVEPYTVVVSGETGDINDWDTSTFRASASGCTTLVSAEVTVQLWHSFLGDLNVSLQAPDGATTTIYESTTWDYVQEWVEGTYPASGSTGNGSWTLVCEDDAFFDAGFVSGWTVTLTCR